MCLDHYTVLKASPQTCLPLPISNAPTLYAPGPVRCTLRLQYRQQLLPTKAQLNHIKEDFMKQVGPSVVSTACTVDQTAL